MTFEEAVREQYGVKIPISASDLRERAFKIDQLRNGFILKCKECGCFGSVIDGECFIWNSGEVWLHEIEHKSSKEINFEWLIWEAARSMLERGERFNAVDSERLALAVKRLERWL